MPYLRSPFALGACALLGATLLAPPAVAASSPTIEAAFISLGGLAEAPAGHVDFCRRVPDQCEAESGGAVQPDLAMLRSLNREVNRSIRQVTDQKQLGISERWDLPSGRNPAGDCEDLALEKRRRLLAMGVPADRLLLAMVYLRGVGMHTVLVVRTAGGDMVLDNRSNSIRTWQRTGYSWLRVQSPDKPLEWRLLAA